MEVENNPENSKLKVSSSEKNIVFSIGKEKELIIFRLKLWNRTDCDPVDVALRIYDADEEEMIATYPLAFSFKSRRLRKNTEVFTPYLSKLIISPYVKRIKFKVEHLRITREQPFHSDFEVKFDLF